MLPWLFLVPARERGLGKGKDGQGCFPHLIFGRAEPRC